MKKTIAILLFSLLVFSCRRDPLTTSMSAYITDGKWHISDFMQNGSQQRTKYASFTFRFTKDHHIIASNGKNSYDGKWALFVDDGTDDAPPMEPELIIEFANKQHFSSFHGDWTILHLGTTGFRLNNINHGQAALCNLAFEKLK